MLALWYGFWNLLDWGGATPPSEPPVVARPGEQCTVTLSGGHYSTTLREVW